MIKIKVTYNNKKIDTIEINGHAGYSESGSDIVCASVSSITITTVNAILKLDSEALIYKEADGYLHITLIKHGKYVNILISNMLDLLKELETKYPKYINLK